jgi:hypothetical protein
MFILFYKQKNNILKDYYLFFSDNLIILKLFYNLLNDNNKYFLISFVKKKYNIYLFFSILFKFI